MSRKKARSKLGWYAYAPLSGTVFVPRGQPTGPVPAAPPRDPYRVRLMNDYGARWPLWPQADPRIAAVTGGVVDDALAVRLRAWAAVFDEHYHHEHGWDDPRLAAEHRAEGEALRDALTAVLPEPWHVELDYWETNGA